MRSAPRRDTIHAGGTISGRGDGADTCKRFAERAIDEIIDYVAIAMSM
jgi:hypothetical protein